MFWISLLIILIFFFLQDFKCGFYREKGQRKTPFFCSQETFGYLHKSSDFFQQIPFGVHFLTTDSVGALGWAVDGFQGFRREVRREMGKEKQNTQKALIQAKIEIKTKCGRSQEERRPFLIKAVKER